MPAADAARAADKVAICDEDDEEFVDTEAVDAELKFIFINYFYMFVIFAFLVIWVSKMFGFRKRREEHSSS